jgi:hypothetical protein
MPRGRGVDRLRRAQARAHQSRNSERGSENLAEQDTFRERMGALFAGPPTGQFAIPTLSDLIDRVERLERLLARRDTE